MAASRRKMWDCNDKSGAGRKKGLKYEELHCVTSTVLSRTTQTQVVETNNSNSMKWGKPVTMLCNMDWRSKTCFHHYHFQEIIWGACCLFLPPTARKMWSWKLDTCAVKSGVFPQSRSISLLHTGMSSSDSRAFEQKSASSGSFFPTYVTFFSTVDFFCPPLNTFNDGNVFQHHLNNR